MPEVKICGLFRERDIDFVNQYLPDYAGFVIKYSKNRHSLSTDKAEALIRLLNPGIAAVGVIANQPLDAASELLDRGIVDILQLRGDESDDYIRALKEKTGKPVWRTFLLRNISALEAAATSSADMVILESVSEDFDWTQCAGFARPFYIAGAINPSNIVRVTKLVSPAGVDLSSGIETDGIKDKGKMSAAIASVRQLNERKR